MAVTSPSGVSMSLEKNGNTWPLFALIVGRGSDQGKRFPPAAGRAGRKPVGQGDRAGGRRAKPIHPSPNDPYRCRGTAHDDSAPSLSVPLKTSRLVLHCLATSVFPPVRPGGGPS